MAMHPASDLSHTLDVRPTLVLRIVAHRRDIAARAIFALAFLAALGTLMELPRTPVSGAALRFELPGALDLLPLPGQPLHDQTLPDPGALLPLAAQSARQSNALVAIEPPAIAAPPFQLSPLLDAAARDRATDCLAAAQWYEAGDDPSGERAVAQVVLNRVRHPAFPGTVCGVVFQGSDRTTGCQFTFTCDGSLARHPSAPAWARARAIAMAALEGAVDPRVGVATHYHADYVVPYWRASLVKTAQVGAHLFYHWPNSFGSVAALLRKARAADEPHVAVLAPLSFAHGGAPEMLATDGAVGAEGPQPAMAGSAHLLAASTTSLGPVANPSANHPDRVEFALDPQAFPGSYAMRALSLCAGKARCVAMGRPAQEGSARLGFLYVRDSRTGAEGAWWDCNLAPRPDRAQCLPQGPAQDRLVAQWL